MIQKTAYLTIDDSPSKDMKKKVDYLFSKKIPAVWFCRGDLLIKRPELAVHAIRKGFIIGNHAYSHRYFSDLTLEECYKEIKKTDKIIEDIYKKSGVKRPAKYFRFPYGDKGGLKHMEVLKGYTGKGRIRKDKLQVFLKKLGYVQPNFCGITYKYYRKAGLLDDVDWRWTYDVMEWTLASKEYLYGIDSLEKVFERMEENAPEKGRGLNLYEGCGGLSHPSSEEIILMHDHPETTKMFKPIIDRLLQKGIVFRCPPPAKLL